MNYYGANDLAAAFRTVRANTIKIAEEIPEDQYGFRAAEGSRTVAELLCHIALGARFHQTVTLTGAVNLDSIDFGKFFADMAAESGQPRTKAELIELLRAEGEKFAGQLEGLTEEFLGQTVTLPEGATPPSKVRFEMLMSVKEHEMHHRAQLMLMQRMLGIKPHLTREGEARMAAFRARQEQAK